jgi:hypothetical protein
MAEKNWNAQRTYFTAITNGNAARLSLNRKNCRSSGVFILLEIALETVKKTRRLPALTSRI